jgi:hypothetical protein
MSTTVAGHLTPEEAQTLRAEIDHLSGYGSGVSSTPFRFLANFDGTNNNKADVPLSGSYYQTNVANIYDQAKANESSYFRTGYYSGPGTGGINGGQFSAAFPTNAMHGEADRAYQEFVEQSRDYLNTHPGATYRDISASVTGFSRGAGTAVLFTQRVYERGLQLHNADGSVTQIAPPHSIAINGMALLDPVATNVEGNLALPPNVQGRVLVLTARDEYRSQFRLLDYSQDPRVTIEPIPGNHCGVGGGYDLQGTAAAALEISTAYLQNSGLDIAPVPQDHRFDPDQTLQIYTEAYNVRNIARDGTEIGTPDAQVYTGDAPAHPEMAWPVDPSPRRSVPAAAPDTPPQPARQQPWDPRNPQHPDHKMYQSLQKQLVALNDTQGIKLTPGQLENGVAALMADARASHIRSVTQLGFGVHEGTNQTDISHVVVYQGQPHDLASDISVTTMTRAIDTPAEQSYQKFEQNTQAMAQRQQAFEQQLQEMQQSQGGPVMRR